MRTEGLLTQSQQLTVELQSRQSELQQTNEELGTKAQAARRAERRGRAQERRGRAGAPRARGEGRRAGAHLEVQVRVPGQHVARAAHAAQLDPDPEPAARRERRRQPDAQAGRVLAQHQLVGLRPAAPDQRHSRPVEDRVGHGHGRGRGDPLRRRCATTIDRNFRHVAEAKNLPFHVAVRRRPAARHGQRPEAAAADPEEPAVQRRQVHRARPRRACGSASPRRAGAPITRCCSKRPAGGRLRRRGHRHRHRAGEAAADLRGLPAGRRRHLAQVRRHRPGPGHQPRAGGAARRRDQAGQRATARAARSRSTCRCTTPARAAASAAPAPATARRRCARRCTVLPVAREEHIADDRDEHRGGRRRAAHHRGRPALRAHPARAWRATRASRASSPPRARMGLSLARQFRPTAISLDIFLPDMLGWTVLNQAQARPGDAPHPGADRHARGGAPARPVARRLLLPGQGADHRRPRGGVRPDQGLHRAAHQAAAGRRGQRHRARSRSSSCSATTTSRSVAVGHRRRGAGGAARRAVRLRGARPAPARHDRLRAAREDAGRAGAGATCRSSSSPART